MIIKIIACIYYGLIRAIESTEGSEHVNGQR